MSVKLFVKVRYARTVISTIIPMRVSLCPENVQSLCPFTADPRAQSSLFRAVVIYMLHQNELLLLVRPFLHP